MTSRSLATPLISSLLPTCSLRVRRRLTSFWMSTTVTSSPPREENCERLREARGDLESCSRSTSASFGSNTTPSSPMLFADPRLERGEPSPQVDRQEPREEYCKLFRDQVHCRGF